MYIGNAIYALCQWSYLSIISKLGSIEMVGMFSLGLAITAPIFIFFNLQLRVVQATDAVDEYSFSNYYMLRVIMSWAAIIITVCVLFFLNLGAYLSFVIMFLAIYKAFESISDIVFGYFQKSEQVFLISISMMTKGILTALALLLVMFVSHEIVWAVLFMSIVMLMVLLFIDLKNVKQFNEIKFVFDKQRLKSLFIQGLPLGFVSMLMSLNTNIPRYFLQDVVGLRELGIFSSISYLMVAGTTVISAVGQVSSPRLSKFFASGDRKAFVSLLMRMIGVSLGVFLCGLLVCYTIGEKLLVLVFSDDFIGFQYLLNLIMYSAGLSFVCSLLSYALTATRIFKAQLPISLLVALSNLIACYWLIPDQGVRGAAIALLISSCVQIIVMSIVLYRKIHKI